MSQDFRAQLRHQLALMRIAAAAFDAGEEVAGKSLATSIRVLVHDTRNSVSLLTHLGVKRYLPFRDPALAEPSSGLVMVSSGLCVLSVGTDTSTYAAPLDELSADRQHPPTCFDDWWRVPVLTDSSGNQFSRASVVLTIANKDGGAHVDAGLPPEWHALTRGNASGYTMVAGEAGDASLAFTPAGGCVVMGDDGERPLPSSIALVSVRQIAHELVSSIDMGLNDDGGNRVFERDPICPIPFSAQPSVGLDSQCPCGGGRRFKDCFGRRQPRRQRDI